MSYLHREGGGRKMLMCVETEQGMRQQQNSGMQKFGKATPLLSNTAGLQGKCDSSGRRLQSSDAVRVKKVGKASIPS